MLRVVEVRACVGGVVHHAQSVDDAAVCLAVEQDAVVVDRLERGVDETPGDVEVVDGSRHLVTDQRAELTGLQRRAEGRQVLHVGLVEREVAGFVANAMDVFTFHSGGVTRGAAHPLDSVVENRGRIPPDEVGAEASAALLGHRLLDLEPELVHREAVVVRVEGRNQTRGGVVDPVAIDSAPVLILDDGRVRIVVVEEIAHRQPAADLDLVVEGREARLGLPGETGFFDHVPLPLHCIRGRIELVLGGLELIFELAHSIIHHLQLVFDTTRRRKLRNDQDGGRSCDEDVQPGSHCDTPPR